VATLIDSSVIIDAQRGRLDLPDVAARFPDHALAIAAIAASELLLGLHLLRDGGKKTRAEAFVEAVLADLPIVPFDLLCARAHARLSAELRRKGAMVGAHDLLIAATAIARGFSVATSDQRSFPRIPGLKVEFFAPK
jgi:predicted nucleic acid-binding protein